MENCSITLEKSDYHEFLNYLIEELSCFPSDEYNIIEQCKTPKTLTLKSEISSNELALIVGMTSSIVMGLKSVIVEWLRTRRKKITLTKTSEGQSIDIEGPVSEKDIAKIERFFSKQNNLL
jgi:hypothetical protein